MKDIQWNAIMIREFGYLACLSDDESAVLHDWAHGKSITETAMNHRMDNSKVKDIRKTLRQKYDAVQPYTPLLPKRAL
jgi:hypothetical protein